MLCCTGEYDKRWWYGDPLQQSKGAGIVISQHICCHRSCRDQTYVCFLLSLCFCTLCTVTHLPLVCECNFYWRFLSYFALPWSEMRHPVLWLLAVQLLQRSNCSQTHRWCMTEWDRRMTIDHYSEQRDRTEILTRKDAVLLVFSFALVFGMLASKQQHEQQQLCF